MSERVNRDKSGAICVSNKILVYERFFHIVSSIFLFSLLLSFTSFSHSLTRIPFSLFAVESEESVCLCFDADSFHKEANQCRDTCNFVISFLAAVSFTDNR